MLTNMSVGQGEANEEVALTVASDPNKRVVMSHASEGALSTEPAKSVFVASRARRRIPWRLLSFLFVTILPTGVVAAYLILFASNQYISEFRFNLRSGSGGTSVADVIGSLAQSSGGMSPSTIWDSQVVVQFIKSPAVIAGLDQKLGFSKIYGRSDADWFSRLKKGATHEEKEEYWKSIVDPFFDMTTGIITVKVRAFTRQDTLDVARTVLALSEDMVNDMSARSRRDAVKLAEEEVAKAEQNLKDSQVKVQQFRNSNNVIDPSKQAEIGIVSQGSRNETLVQLKSQYAILGKYLSPEAPSMKIMQAQIDTLEGTIRSEQSRLTQGPSIPSAKSTASTAPTKQVSLGPTLASPQSDANLTSIITDYQTLMIDQGLKERVYSVAEEALQKARVDAERQQLYLNAFVQPILPEESLYPQRLKSVMMTFGISTVVWILLTLGVYGIRDHL